MGIIRARRARLILPHSFFAAKLEPLLAYAQEVGELSGAEQRVVGKHGCIGQQLANTAVKMVATGHRSSLALLALRGSKPRGARTCGP
jgi:hypothetical protein